MTSKIIIHKKKLAQDIKRICQKKEISIPALEAAVGYSPGMISRWASSSDDEDFNVLSKLVTMANILEVSVDNLLGVQKDKETISQTENSDIFSILTQATVSGRLVWNVLDPQKNQLPFGYQLPDSESSRIVAKAWYTVQENVTFTLVSYCDDMADFNEPLELVLYGFVGHGIAPLQLHAPEPKFLHTLYAYIQFIAASKSLLYATGQNQMDIAHIDSDSKNILSDNNMIVFEHIKQG